MVAIVPYHGEKKLDRPPGTAEGALPLVTEPYTGPLKYALMATWLRELAAFARAPRGGGGAAWAVRSNPGGGR